jgi:hypothetical protein
MGGAIDRFCNLDDALHFLFAIAEELIDRDHHRHAEFPHIADMAFEIGRAALDRTHVGFLEIFLGDAAVMLESANRGHDHRRGRIQFGFAAFDIEEFLGA